MKTAIAVLLYLCRIRWNISTFIDEDTITVGYGRLYADGAFQYPVPRWLVMKHYHTTSWDEYMHTHFHKPRRIKK
jgi:hypothetical protein